MTGPVGSTNTLASASTVPDASAIAATWDDEIAEESGKIMDEQSTGALLTAAGPSTDDANGGVAGHPGSE
ncbi:hypothetical protein J7E25_05765 [Agromyces sp. ISL-38]|uniref:hypothetical protein n=1 Tax=Agromyces sp. ISL-38 TaxID=2819107 RepID=UPI001BEC984A|nr:hypothetical protein [Agromyces sp. ISL-38]MBT2498596.1 hypothetical protein [Agromyces sp. ISL-38]